MHTATNSANGLLLSPSPVEAPRNRGFLIGIGNNPDFNAGEKVMNFTAYQADDFTRRHPVLVGERKGTTLRERLERIRAKAKKASVREAAEQWLRKTEVAA